MLIVFSFKRKDYEPFIKQEKKIGLHHREHEETQRKNQPRINTKRHEEFNRGEKK